MTTELPAGATVLDNGDVQVEGYTIAAGTMGMQSAIHFISAELVTEGELAGGPAKQ